MKTRIECLSCAVIIALLLIRGKDNWLIRSIDIVDFHNFTIDYVVLNEEILGLDEIYHLLDCAEGGFGDGSRLLPIPHNKEWIVLGIFDIRGNIRLEGCIEELKCFEDTIPIFMDNREILCLLL